MKRLTLVLLVAAVLVGGVSRGETISVDSTVPSWQDSGIYVTTGQTLSVAASGIVYCSYGDGQGYTDPNGVGNVYNGTQTMSDTVLPSAIVVSLIGKIGGTTAVGTGIPVSEGMPGKGPGFVGSSYDEVIPESGELFFAYNDQLSDFGDNYGSYTVTASLSPTPEPSTFALLGVGAIGLLAYAWRKRK